MQRTAITAQCAHVPLVAHRPPLLRPLLRSAAATRARHLAVRAAGKAGGGFGNPKKQRASGKTTSGHAKIDGSQRQDKAVKQALRAAGATRPVDPSEAARGRVDVATVRDWGSGQPGDLGQLRVEAVEARYDAADDGRPLSAVLAQQLQNLEAQGALRLADGGKPPPPFERWSLSRQRYLGYLADAAAVHGALEDAVGEATAVGAHAPLSAPVVAALVALGPGSGLYRGRALAHDLQALAAAPPQAAAPAADGALPLMGSRAETQPPAPGGSAVAFAAHLGRLAATARSPAASQEERDTAALRLAACAYSLLATFHSLGVRVGAAAAERSGAAAAGALRCYTDYPDRVADPAAALVAAVDTVGAGLSRDQRRALCSELPRAFPKAALLVAALAFE